MFKLVVVQKCSGCDYTIGCGTLVVDLEATDESGAREEAEKYIKAGGGYLSARSEYEIKSAMVVEVTEELPLGAWKAEYEEARTRRKAADAEAKELAELARLKAKYGG